jgi:hypothetical protein
MMKLAWLWTLSVAAAIAGQVDLSVSINGAAKELRSSSPLFISATLADSADAVWAQAAAVTITAGDGTPVTLTPVLRSATASNGFSRALWTVSPDQIRNLAPGPYTVQVGEARASFRVTLQEASTDAERERDVVLQARWNALDGRAEQARNDVNAWLASHPSSVAVLVLKADLHESLGQWPEALACITRAVAATNATDHGPVPLLRRQASLLERE